LVACGADSKPSASASSSSATIVTAPSASAFPFDTTSARQFPGTSLDHRLQMAQQVCDSIRAHGDDYVAWLNLTKTRSDLVTFSSSAEILVSFSGLAVKALCPEYVAQLQGALEGGTVTSAPPAPSS
jgi:hypothetical protein